MGDVIRPTFGKPSSGESPDVSGGEIELMHGFGEAAGYQVSLIRQRVTPTGDVYKIVVGLIDEDEVHTVAMTPATPAGEADAAMAAAAVMRTLELIEANATPDAG